MKMEHMVLNHLQNKTTVMDCPECECECYSHYEKKYLKDFGVCSNCDAKYQ